MLSIFQQEIRSQGITATDIAAIVGRHPHRRAIDVWQAKRAGVSLEDDAEDAERARWGGRLEPVIRDEYAERHGVAVIVPGTVVHVEHVHHVATPDGLVFEHGATDAARGLEIKTHTVWLRGDYGPVGTDQVPDHELLQCAWNMHVTGLERWDLVAFIDGLPHDYVIRRDLELEYLLRDAADRFWQDHVIGGVPPAPDGSAAYSDWLERRFPANERRDLVIADGDARAAILELREVIRAEGKAKKRRAQLTQKLKSLIGDREGIELSCDDAERARITWARSTDAQVIDWQAAATELAARLGEDINSVAQKHTTTRPGSRRFCPPRSWHRQDEESE